MNKIFQKTAKISGRIGLILLGLLIILMFLFDSSLLQTKLLNHWLAQQSRAMGISARVQHVDVSLLSRHVKIFGVEIYDHHQNLLLDLGILQTSVHSFSVSHLTLGVTHASDVEFRLRRYENDSVSNLKHIIDFFNTSPKDSNAPSFAIKSSAFFLKNANASYVDEVESKGDAYQFVDFKNMFLNNLNLSLKNVNIIDNTVLATIENLTFLEKKGFEITKFSARLSLSEKGVVARKLDVATARSNLNLDVKFTTETWKDYKNFVSNVKLYAQFRNTILDFKDLVYFAPKLEGKHNKFCVSGSVLGQVGNFRAKNFDISYGQNTRFFGDIMMSGLPKFKTTFFDVSIKNFTTTPKDVDDFLLPNANKIAVSKDLYKLSTTSLSGQITGFSSDLTAFLNINSAMGHVQTDFHFFHDTLTKTVDFSGDIDNSLLALGDLLNEKTLGNNLSLTGSFDGRFSSKSGMDLSINMTCENVEFQKRKINVISVKGDLENQLISATVSIDDDDGTAEFSGEMSIDPKNLYVNASGFFKNVDLVAFRLLKDTNQPLLSSKFSGKLSHFNLDSLIGFVTLSNLNLALKDTTFLLNNFAVSQQILQQGVSTKIDCDFFKANVFGDYKISNLNAIWNDIQTNYFSALKLSVEEIKSLENQEQHSPSKNSGNGQKQTVFQTLDLVLNVHKTGGLLSYFLPQIHLPQGANVQFGYNGNHQPLSLNIATKNATVYGFRVSNLDLNGHTRDSIFEINMDAKNLQTGNNRYFEDFSIATKFQNDFILWRFDWIGNSDQDRPIKGNLDGSMNVLSNNQTSLNIQNSKLFLGNQLWQFDPNSTIITDFTGVHFQNIRFFNQNNLSEYLKLNGDLSKNPNSVLNLAFNHYQLAPWTPIIKRIGMDIDGAISGEVDVFDFFNNLRFSTNLKIEDFSINQFNYETAFLQIIANEKTAENRIKFDIRNNGKNYLSADGYFYSTRKNQNFDINILISELDLSLLKNYMQSFSSSLTGKFGGQLTLDGPLRKPNFYGDLTLDNAVVKIDYLNTYYAIKPKKVVFSLDSVIFVNTNLEDVLNKTQGVLSGGLYHHRFKDFRTNLGLSMNNFLAMNTTHLHNETFFGKVFITGDAHLSGPVQNLLIDVHGRTEKNTELQINHSSKANISESNQFIHFVVPERKIDTTALDEPVVEMLPNNMTVRLNIDVTPDASVFFDMDAPLISGMINAQGTGNLRMNFESRTQNFTLFGDYVLQDGYYDFTFEDRSIGLGSLITKRFYIERGGTVQWTGNPGNMILDVSAIYSTRASLAPVLANRTITNTNTMRRVNVQSVITLSGRLPQPEIKFDFRLPNVDDDTRTEFFSVVNRDDENEMTQQTFSLLLLGGFTTPGDNSNIGAIGGGANNPVSMAYDMVFNQLNNVLQNLTGDNFNFGVIYRPEVLNNTQQTQLTMSTQFFDNRLLIDGHVGQGGLARNSLSNPDISTQQTFMREFNLEWRWTNRLSLKAFQRPNEREFRATSQMDYLSGGGIAYRREFDAFRPVFRRRK
ncbi:MAG: translocation/assembly module TamB [Bacteroidales bacterium]|nr:translocation/assembly module TamB [Bacteroidales bacterium]